MENNIQRNGEPELPKGPPQVPITKSTPSANNLGSNSVKKDRRSSSRFNISKNRELTPLPRLTGKCRIILPNLLAQRFKDPINYLLYMHSVHPTKKESYDFGIFKDNVIYLWLIQCESLYFLFYFYDWHHMTPIYNNHTLTCMYAHICLTAAA